MKLTVTAAAEEKLAKYNTPGTLFVLDFEDGVGLSKQGSGTCSFDKEFTLVIADHQTDLSDYQKQLDATYGTWYYKGYSAAFMDSDMTLTVNPRYSNLELKGNRSGLLSADLRIKDVRGKQLSPAHIEE